jgi:hypothetical protein
MENNDTQDHIDHQRWLIDNGFINDLHKDTLYMYGSLVHKEVSAVYCCIDIANKLVKYEVFLTTENLKKYYKFHTYLNKQLSQRGGIIDMWLFKRFINKNGSFDFKKVLTNFVKSYLGTSWNVELQVKDVKDYEEGFDNTQ